MTPVNFPQQNTKIGKGQPEYRPLPAFIDHPGENNEWKRFVVKYELSALELAQITKTKVMFFTQQGFGFNPILPQVESPFEFIPIKYLNNECWVPLTDGGEYHLQAESPEKLIDAIIETFSNLKVENLFFIEKPLLSVGPDGSIKKI